MELFYPGAFRYVDDEHRKATINSWAMSFSDIPYSIMEQALNQHRFKCKYAPRTAEIGEELKSMHYRAIETAMLHEDIGNRQMAEQWRRVASITSGYRMGVEAKMIGGQNGSGTPRNLLDRADGIPVLDAGRD
jgi:hypothetical protein